MNFNPKTGLNSEGPRYQFYLITLTLAVICTMAMVYWYHVNGVRGSDQYWYLADTETLITGGRPVTNTVFPGILLRGGDVNAETLFAHNGPLLHINAAIGKITGAFIAWKLTNILFLIIAAGTTGFVVSRFDGYAWGCIAALIYILSPISIWLAGNILLETFFSAITAVLLLLIIHRHQGVSGGWLLPGVLLVGSLSHPMYTLLGFLFALQLIVERKSWGLLIGVISALIISGYFKDFWFPSSFQPDLKTIIAGSKPGVSNMLWQLSDVDLSITPQLLIAKLMDALRTQFATPRFVPFNLITNAGIGALGFLLMKHWRRYGYFLAIALICFGIYFALIVLMQNQFRYQLLIAPVSVATLVLALSHFQWSVWGKRALVSLLVGFALCDIFLLRIIRSDSIKEGAALQAIISELSDIPDDYKIAIIDSNFPDKLPLLFALRPRKSLIVDSDLLSKEKIDEALALFSTDLVIIDNGEDEPHFYGDLVREIPNNQGSGKSLKIYSPAKQPVTLENNAR